MGASFVKAGLVSGVISAINRKENDDVAAQASSSSTTPTMVAGELRSSAGMQAAIQNHQNASTMRRRVSGATALSAGSSGAKSLLGA